MMWSSFFFAAIQLVSPAPNAYVPLLTEAQRTVVTNVTLEARQKVLTGDTLLAKRLQKSKEWRMAQPLRLCWKVTNQEQGPWQVELAEKADFSDARQYLIEDKQKEYLTIPRANLKIATRYYWRVTSQITCGRWDHSRVCTCPMRKPSVMSSESSFVTEDLAPRWIAIEGRVGNFRDLGGRLGLKGQRVRQGLIFRSEGLNDNSVDGQVPGRNRLMIEDLHELITELGIKTDLDLRNARETAGMKTSPMGTKVQFIHHSSEAYQGIFTASGKSVMAQNFRIFLKRDNYPILFHCIGGADRTGALAYVLNGVLGVSRHELETDWEHTFYPVIPLNDAKGKRLWRSEEHFNRGFARYGTSESSWNERIVLYLKDCGISDQEIETFRSIMLETKSL